MRFLADIPDDDVKWLDERAVELGKSRASVLREVVAAYRADSSKDWLEAGFGVWARHGVVIDDQDDDSRRRAEWVRPWDDDYEEIRAQSPESFTEQDDRERAHYLALSKAAVAKFKKKSA